MDSICKFIKNKINIILFVFCSVWALFNDGQGKAVMSFAAHRL